eukprot:TRINITY_DN3612_c0_g2_i1.p1 TRINITY_DN3612_c0_g2~~TRINITY_DN3612_c0_g2_i1.p1  ORF type:complete len:526 (+),score=92.88 TRINITY_DN3612_c0_g2_i1:207-1580(+)
MGRGDCDASIDDAFAEWMANLWVQLHSTLELSMKHLQDGPVINPVSYKIVEDKIDFDKLKNIRSDWGKLNNAFRSAIIENRELQTSKDRSTRHIEIKLPEGVTYTAGDHLAVFPLNLKEVVLYAAKILKIDPEAIIVLDGGVKHRLSHLPYDTPISVFLVLKFCVELQQLITRAQILYLIDKTTDESDKLKLKQIAAVESDSNEYNFAEFVTKPKRTLLEVLSHFPSVNISFGEFLALVPPIKPRYYSISSSPLAHPRSVHITVAVVEGKSPTGRHHYGVASNYLASLAPEEPVAIMIRKSTFRLPEDGSKPVIMIGPGTGLAPMRGFIQERIANGASGANLLFFGCRNDQDFIYQEELQKYASDGHLKLEVAFSRKQSHKVYVQDCLLNQGSFVYDLFQKGAYIYVCGDAKFMSTAVRETFVKIVEANGDQTPTEAQEYIAALTHTKRYLEDVWAG